jgi:CheY-like chemotaxis protein
MMDDALKQKFLLQMLEHLQELKVFQNLVCKHKYDDLRLFHVASTLHKVAGLCLTFGFKEEGNMARYIEMRMQNISDTVHPPALIKISALITNLIETCELSLKKLKGSIHSPESESSQEKNSFLHQGQQLHVFVADDDPIIRSLMVQQFERKGIRVTPFKDGAYVLDQVSLDKPHLIILDENMPYMNGSEVCEKLLEHEHVKDIPVFLLSGYRLNQIDSLDSLSNVKEVIEKPFKVEEIIQKMQLYI